SLFPLDFAAQARRLCLVIPMIDVSALSVTLGNRQILHEVSFSAVPGALTAVIGPNGSGKSTLLKAICRDHAYLGKISINGRDLASLGPVQAAALRAVLPQPSTLPFPFTVREVVALGLTAGRPGIPLGMIGQLPD